MSQNVDRKLVLKALKKLGFVRSKGNATGHDIFINPEGVKVQASVRKSEVGIDALFALASEMEAKRVIARRAFIDMVKCRKSGGGAV